MFGNMRPNLQPPYNGRHIDPDLMADIMEGTHAQTSNLTLDRFVEQIAQIHLFSKLCQYLDTSKWHVNWPASRYCFMNFILSKSECLDNVNRLILDHSYLEICLGTCLCISFDCVHSSNLLELCSMKNILFFFFYISAGGRIPMFK